MTTLTRYNRRNILENIGEYQVIRQYLYRRKFVLKKTNFMAPFYGWGSTASRLEPLRGGSLLFTTKSIKVYVFLLNLLNYKEHNQTNDFSDSLASNSFILLILQPNRITSHSNTLIDNIFSNAIDPGIISGNLTATISDHLPQFSIIPNMFGNISDNESNIYERDWSKFDQENFILDYFSYHLISLLSNIEKILEKLMYKRLYTFLNTKNIIYDLQFGFRQQYSTSHVLINITENTRKALYDRLWSSCRLAKSS